VKKKQEATWPNLEPFAMNQGKEKYPLEELVKKFFFYCKLLFFPKNDIIKT
jgi:hypothetical protein